MKTIFCLFILVLATADLAWAADKVDFAHDVLPVLKARCAKCHTNGTYKGRVSMDTRETLLASKVVVPGNAGESALIHRVTSTDVDVRMPPEGPPLAEKQIATLRAWIDQRLPWQQGFSFKAAKYVVPLRLRSVKLPPVHDGRTHPIDRIVDAYYAKNRITPPPPLDDTLFLRRLSLDVLGLLPKPEEIASFEDDRAPDKRQTMVREILNRRRQYTEHWLTFWNDLLRNDYQGTGYIDGGRKQITAWLYRSLMENKPYDQFTRELINPTAESEGFIRGIKWRGRVNASQVRELQFAQNVAQVMLGLNLKCASCHDSFINEWKLADAYGMAAIVSEKPLELHRCDKPTGKIAKARFLFPELGTIDPRSPRNKRLQRLATLLTSRENGRFSRTIVNRLWQRLLGRGIVEPVDVMSNEPWSEDLLDYLAMHLVQNGYDLKKTLELILTSRTYQSQTVSEAEPSAAGPAVFRGPVVKRMTAEQFLDGIWRITGTAPRGAVAKVGARKNEPVRASLVAADPLMRSLGRPNREQVVTTRLDQLTTLQALDLSNGQILANTLSRGAANLRRAHPNWSPRQTVDWLYRAALCRLPTPQEAAIAGEVLGQPATVEGLADLLWIVIMLPEFQLIR